MAKQSLEELPNELLISILFQISDKNSLRSLVLASPACHTVYLTVRRKVLYCILERQYSQFLPDLSEAIAVIRSKGLYMEADREKAIAFLDSWRRRDEIRELNLTPTTQLYEPGNLEEIIELFHFYHEMEFFVDDYSKNVPRPTWMNADKWHKEVLPLTLSATEKLRIFRALCRLQLGAHIFGKVEESPFGEVREFINDLELSFQENAWRLFFGTMAPWEWQEMGCVWEYLGTKLDPVYKEIYNSLKDCGCDFFWDLSKDQQLPGYVLETVTDLKRLPYHTEMFLSLGPRFIYKVVHGPFMDQRNLIAANAGVDVVTPLFKWFKPWNERPALLYPADKYDLDDIGACVSGLPSTEQPNYGWITRVLDSPGPRLFEHMFDRIMEYPREQWRWGYAIWDSEKLKEWKAPLIRKSIESIPEPVRDPLLLPR